MSQCYSKVYLVKIWLSGYSKVYLRFKYLDRVCVHNVQRSSKADMYVRL